MKGVEATDGSISEEHVLKTLTKFGGNGLFNGLDSAKALNSFTQNQFQAFEPEPVDLFKTEMFDLEGNSYTVQHRAYVSPFLPSLKRLISRPDVLHCIENPLEHEKGVYKTFQDGSYARNHPILSDPQAIAIQMCYDDLEVSSPLGPVKHQLSFYYWTLLNIHPNLRAVLRSINLLGIAWKKDLVPDQKDLKEPFVSLDPKFKNHCKILEPFLRDIKILEKGINVEINGQMRQFKGTLANITGDTPAVAVMSGTKESVSIAHKPCHLCLADHHEMKAIFKEEAFEKRTLNYRARQLEALQKANTVKNREAISVSSGYNGPSVTMGLESFHQIDCFVFDAMHILHEGCLEAHMRVLLNYYVNEKGLFDLKEINIGVKKVAKQLFSKDRPAFIKPHHLKEGLRQSASQMLSLAFCLPFVLERKADKEGRLQNFVLLLEIVNGLLCYEISDGEIAKLKEMIEEHHSTFMVHYPDFSITPKFHFVIHLPSQASRHGPTRYTWTMRLVVTLIHLKLEGKITIIN